MAERSSREARKSAQITRILLREQEQSIIRQLKKILKKDEWERNEEEQQMLIHYPEAVDDLQQRKERQVKAQERLQEIADPPEELKSKCDKLATAIKNANSVVVYTGAGISTAAEIPDYRGPMGVWTLLKKGKELRVQDLSSAEPTFSHMALFELHKRNLVSHVVSQNCDGLHLRSGLPQKALSEVHGNMYIEVCSKCKPVHQFIRLFDVTEQTALHRHRTGRKCSRCKSDLLDTIVHFGERGKLKWPLNWKGGARAAKKCDLILCLGTSLKVLKKYQCLWCQDRPVKDRPDLYIVNLQWTPKDDQATLKINGKCDDVMKHVMEMLNIEVTNYCKSSDPLFDLVTPLTSKEESTCNRKQLTLPPDIAIKHTPCGPRRSPRLLAILSTVFVDHSYAQISAVDSNSVKLEENSDCKEPVKIEEVVSSEQEDSDSDASTCNKRRKKENKVLKESDKLSNSNRGVGWFGRGYQKGRKVKTKRI